MKKIALAALMLVAVAASAECASFDDLNTGIQFHNLGDWNNAILYFGKALDANDLIPSLQFTAHLDRAQAQANLGHYDLAIPDYSASLDLRPGNVLALSGRSRAYLNDAKLDQAAADLDTIIAAHPLLSSPYLLRAAVNARRGQPDKGVEDLKMVLSLRPESPWPNRGVGAISWQVGHFAEAEEDFSYRANTRAGNIYGWLWFVLTELHLNKEVPRSDLPKFDDKKWPAPIVSLFLGETPQDAVFAASQMGEAADLKGQVCEANFYVGEWLLQHHDAAGAKPLLRKAADNCPMNFEEWGPAQMDLARLP